MNKQLSALMQQEMTRKEFLTTLGFGLATVMGFGSIIRFLTGKQSLISPAQPHNTIGGYGASTYGGVRN